MKTIQVLFIHSMMFHGRIWQRAAECLKHHGISLSFTAQELCLETLASLEPDLVVADLSSSDQALPQILETCSTVPNRLGLSAELPADFTTFSADSIADFHTYTAELSPANYAGAILLLAHEAGFPVEVPEKEEIHTCGIYHPLSPEPFITTDDFFNWQKEQRIPLKRRVAILFYYGQLVEGSLLEINQLIQVCEENGLSPIPIFSAGVETHSATTDFMPLLTTIPGLGLILSCMAGRLLKSQGDTSLLQDLDVPVIQTMRSHSQTPEEWFADPQGLPTMSAVFSQVYPEMFGATRPTIIAAIKEQPTQEKRSWMRTYLPISERIDTLVGRIVRHFRLQEKENREKQLTIVLHNNPCKGVEATIGMAVGLDTMTSLGLLLQRLRDEGYELGDCPTDGQALLDTFLSKKAIAEFRWTTVDEIITKGGCLHMMEQEEYQQWFDTLHPEAKNKILQDWGPFPGESMAWKKDDRQVLVITGLRYGKLHIINQPKRGCYGAKCNGEVCRILHDPTLAPPHHWFATYKYIRDNSDALIHFGTEGALEYLPGKQNGLSGCCFPEITLGSLPNFYVYVMDAIGEGMVAKRRGQATLVDHLGPVLSPSPLDDSLHQLDHLLDQYRDAKSDGAKARLHSLQNELAPLLEQLQLPSVTEAANFDEQVDLTRRHLSYLQRAVSSEGLHILGQSPDEPGRGRLLATMLRKPPPGLPSTDELGRMIEGDSPHYWKVARLLANDNDNTEVLSPSLLEFRRKLYSRLSDCKQEIDRLLHCLEGGYIPPGPAGSPASGRMEVLPTGKNFYAKDVSLLPTRAAHTVGQQMAHTLLSRYLQEEGCFPKRVGISIWSSDAFKSDGELFCQILSLMGVRPSWDNQGKVSHLEVIPLHEMTLDHNGEIHHLPRVDVTIETSGIMRDMVPHFCELLDQAVLLVSELDEPHQWNSIKKHSDEMFEELQRNTECELSHSEMRRMANFRIFSSAPGTYGLGVGLALDASAWTSDKDLAEIYINAGGHALSSGTSTVARDILARQFSQLDIAYMKLASEEYDILDCGCYAVSLGSMATVTRALSGKEIKLYWADTGEEREICDVKEQLHRSTATRLLNRRWIEAMKEHGYQGAMAMSSRVNNLFKWSAVSHMVTKELFDQVVNTYIIDDELRKWLIEQNPYAMEEITRRLLEAESRELWQADADLLNAVQRTALEIEGEMEERMGDVSEEFQGSQVEVITADQVDTWKKEWSIDR